MKPVIVCLEDSKFIVECCRAGALRLQPFQHILDRVLGLFDCRCGKDGVAAFTGLGGFFVTR